MIDLSTNLAGIDLRNPAILAAGTAGTLDEMRDVLDLSRVGAVVTKSITREPREGNQTWRLIESSHSAAMLNAVGLANVGIDEFLRSVAPRVPSVPCVVVGSVSEFSIEGFVHVCRAFDSVAGLHAVELNVSCPNVHSGCEFGSDAGLLAELLAAVRPSLARAKLFVKLSPIAMGVPGGVAALARAAVDRGADALCITNTVPAMAIDVETRRPRLSRASGGLSGPAIHPIALKLVRDAYISVCRDANVPIVGIGGVTRWQDAAEFLLAGASAFEMGTALFADPRSPLKVLRGLERWARRQRADRLRDLVGTLDA